LERGDVPAVLSTFDPQIQWREAEDSLYADGNPYAGPQAATEGVFQRIASAVENFTVLPEHFVEEDDTVVVEGRYRGKLKTTGKPIDAQFGTIVAVTPSRKNG
jgi:ketosteroid isomerase-like protein